MIKPNWKIPKIKLVPLLRALLLAALLIEGVVLYKSLFHEAPADGARAEKGAEEPLVIDTVALRKLQSWLAARGAALPPERTGNPFAEYR